MHERTRLLRDLMRTHKLTCPDVAEKLDRSPNTVRMWSSESGGKIIPDGMVRLLDALLRLECR